MDDFAAFGLETGPEMLERHRGPSTIGGYLAAVEASGRDVETVALGHGLAVAGGRITTDALRFFEDRLRTGLAERRAARRPRDAPPRRVLGRGRRRRRGPAARDRPRGAPGGHVPIVLTIDHHANVTQAMVDGCDALVGYRTQPHDPFDTAVASTNLLLRIVAGEVRPTMAWRKIPLLSHQEQYLTSGGPMKTWFDRARALEREPGVLSVSTFPMQPWLDVDEAGWAAVVVTDGDRGARRARGRRAGRPGVVAAGRVPGEDQRARPTRPCSTPRPAAGATASRS